MPIDRPGSGDQSPDRDEGTELRSPSWRLDSPATSRERPPPSEDILAARAYDERLKAAKQAELGDMPADEPDKHQRNPEDDRSESWPRFGDHRDEGVTDENVEAAYERMVQREGTPAVQAAQEIAWEREALEKYGPPARALSGPEVREFNQRIRAQQGADTSDDPPSTNEPHAQYSSPEAAPQPAEKPAKHRAEPEQQSEGDVGQEHADAEGRPEERTWTEPRWSPERREWVDGMPDAEHAVVDSRKFGSYSMDPGNENNDGKYKAWQQLGYDVADENVRDELSTRITEMVESGAGSAEVVDHESHPRGHTYELRFDVDGPSGSDMTGTLVTIWLRKPAEDAPRLITNWVEVHTDKGREKS